ncbi:MAG: ABC transporter substrate-binding protein [Sulfurifustaceae bacterium]
MKLLRKMFAVTLAAAGVAGATLPTQAAEEIFVPALVYRTGAYAPNGIPFADGFADYLKLVNARDGGVNGVKIAYDECETGYATDRGVECYERIKSRKPVAINPVSTGITFAITEKAPTDKIPIFTTGYGRSESTDGSVFPWNFPFLGTYWDAADILVQHVSKKGSLKGKKIALVYHDSPFGKEPIPVLEARAKQMGFELIKLPVTHPGVEQKATWLQVRQQRPDYVFLWGWGVMNSAALKEAVAVGYPRSQMYGVWWSASEPDVLPVGDGAVGYSGITLQQSDENDLPVHKDVMKYLYDKGQGSGKKEEVGTVLWNRGMVTALMVVESIRTAQAKFGKKALTGEQVRWGAEHLNIDEARLKALGLSGMMQPIKTSCSDHTGAYKARIHTWDGKHWNYTSDWYTADLKFLRPMVEAQAKQYATEKSIQPRDCGKEA